MRKPPCSRVQFEASQALGSIANAFHRHIKSTRRVDITGDAYPLPVDLEMGKGVRGETFPQVDKLHSLIQLDAELARILLLVHGSADAVADRLADALYFSTRDRRDRAVKWASRYAACRTSGWLWSHLNRTRGEMWLPEYWLSPQTCNTRICPYCARRRADVLSTRVLTWMAGTSQTFFHVVLSPAHDCAEPNLRHVAQPWGSLRACGHVEKLLGYGLRVSVISASGHRWWPHHHIICSGPSGMNPKIDIAALEKHWQSRIPGASVHVQRIKHAAAVSYIFRPPHLTKDGTKFAWSLGQVFDWFKGVRGKRMYETFGMWPDGEKLDLSGPLDRDVEFFHEGFCLGPIREVVRRAASGSIQDELALRSTPPLPDYAVAGDEI